jgi:hypothetical protein
VASPCDCASATLLNCAPHWLHFSDSACDIVIAFGTKELMLFFVASIWKEEI